MEPSGDSTYQDEAPSCSKGADSPTKDKLFDPSIDMLINDFDDERTLEEEEALAAGESVEDPSTELSNLEREGNMPLEELLALYGYNKTKSKESASESEEEEDKEVPMEEEEICETVVEQENCSNPPRQSKLTLLYEPMSEDVDNSKNLASVSKISEDEEEELDSNADEDDYQKFPSGIHNIMVGSDYQAQVPEGLTNYDQDPANDKEDQLLWSPQEIYPTKVEEYLRKVQELLKPPTIPNGNVLRDDEEALYILKESGYNGDEALRKLEIKEPSEPAVCNGHDAKWSEEECRNFESGVRAFGKDFLQIQQNKVPTKSVGEIVQFYYLWKKTERHDVFANRCRLEKKKYSFNPGVVDFLDRFLEDQDVDFKSPSAATGTPLDGT
ncbi:mesoderm induction early response protein 1-like [Euwallacea fornicatus]|uniref:mesoderm induction early response protein 1-like n=1 Tax=Euwallacea fornicatus TaxID=995702 RepID=UPI00338E9C53